MAVDPMKNRLVLVAGAEPAGLARLSALLRDWGYHLIVATSVDACLAELSQKQFLFTILDLTLDGGEVLRRLKTQGGAPGPIIVAAEDTDGERAAEAAALGAEDFIHKPFTTQDLENVLKSALARPHRPWRRAGDDDGRARLYEELALWRSPKMCEVREILEQSARVDVTVLISGETGTGKDLVARAIHDASIRQGGPFVKVNCAAVPRELLESELFGHERGAFTGAHQLKIGKFEAADRGTIFLDEIGDLHPALQGKLLHVLQDGQFSRVGGRSTVKVDVRTIAATNQDLERAVAEGRFRQDLYYRLNVIQIRVPPLRERIEEIPALVNYFVNVYASRFRRDAFALSAAALDNLVRQPYPGNVRELENLVKRMIVLGEGSVHRASAEPPAEAGFPSQHAIVPDGSTSLRDIVRQAAR